MIFFLLDWLRDEEGGEQWHGGMCMNRRWWFLRWVTSIKMALYYSPVYVWLSGVSLVFVID